ncbi:unnamed protein product [Aureobasidium pullulans]|nr:unnamed protein product [Aureobasidium pullulans]
MSASDGASVAAQLTGAGGQQAQIPKTETSKDVQNERRQTFKRRHGFLVGFFTLILYALFHVLGIFLFLSGFLLTRLVLDHKSECAVPPVALGSSYTPGSVDDGCWHPKSFDKAVVIIVDALRYDFTVPWSPKHPQHVSQHFHNALPIFWDTAVAEPENAFLLPFIADPPTTTLQRLKGLTTGTLPTFIDAGSNFAGTAIEEDNLVAQLKAAGKRLVHLGDDTWHSLFPGYFDPELTRAYDSFNVWDLHTVDNGMNTVFERMIAELDDKTLLVVMGDHGMDAKGDHGGESDDEVEAALWMYSKQGLFGRRDESATKPPFTAKERPVAQIDLVPTLSLLLGMPIPFNNLGRPIEEAFIGRKSNDYQNLAQVSHLTAAQIHRYQKEYSAVRKLDSASTLPPETLWGAASKVWDEIKKSKKPSLELWQAAYAQFSAYQQENLRVCKSLWARFDLTSMAMGIILLTGALLTIALFANGFSGDRGDIVSGLCIRGIIGMVVGAGAGLFLGGVTSVSWINSVAFFAGLSGILGSLSCFASTPSTLRVPLPNSFWGWICTIPPVLLCIGFASNSFTIWEDEILLYMLSSIGALMLASSLRLQNPQERLLGSWHSLSFIVLTRLASLSRLCREEQMPFCRSTYYASATSSTSAWWQLTIPFIIAVILPSAIRDFFARTKNYQGTAVLWLSIAFRIGLVFSATYWILDAADDNEWIPQISSESLKTIRVFIAQAILAIAWAAGYSAYLYSAPFLGIETETPAPETELMDPTDPTSAMFTPVKPQQRKKLIILGYANTHGTRYFLLPTIWALVLLLLQKPMGQGTLALCLLSILNLLEIIDANDLRNSPLGPVTLALMAGFYFFKTGHQATLSSIQWESAFIPLKTIKYPWSPMLVIISTFAPYILCALAVPTIAFWKVPPRTPGLLNHVAKALATHVVVYAAIALATVIEAAWLRRHLMLYRIFMPRMLLGVVVLLVVELVGVIVGLLGVRSSIRSVAEVFGWGPLAEELPVPEPQPASAEPAVTAEASSAPDEVKPE